MQRTPKKPVREDWHPADVKAALEKAGWTMRQLSLAHGFCGAFCANAFKQRSHNAQTIIADALGLKPWDIWPSRYDEHHEPVSRRKPFAQVRPKHGENPGGRRKVVRKDTQAAEICNGNDTAGNVPADTPDR